MSIENLSEWDDKPQVFRGLQSVEFAKTERSSYKGEVGKIGDDLIFHFWPTDDARYSRGPNDKGEWEFSEVFPDALATSFIEVFKLEDKLSWDFVPEMNSWAVRARGFGSNTMANELATKLFNSLQDRLER